jgi:hypothetical protein
MKSNHKRLWILVTLFSYFLFFSLPFLFFFFFLFPFTWEQLPYGQGRNPMVSAFHSNFDISCYFNIQNKLVSHDYNPSFFLFLFFLLLPLHLTHTPEPGFFSFLFFFFFFFSLTSPATADPAVTHHLRPTHLRRRSPFPAKLN